MPQPYSQRSLDEWITDVQRAELAEDRLRALQAVGFLAKKEETARWAAHSLKDPDATIRALAAKLLADPEIVHLVNPAAELVSLLSDPDPDVRFESARTLIKRKSVENGRAVPILLSFLDEPETHPLMVAAIVNLLVEAGSLPGLTETELLPRLRQRLAEERGEIREAVATAFAKWPKMCQTTADELLPLLDDSEPVVREKIAEAFGQSEIDNEKIRAALQIASHDEDSEVARVAVQALECLNRRRESRS